MLDVFSKTIPNAAVAICAPIVVAPMIAVRYRVVFTCSDDEDAQQKTLDHALITFIAAFPT